MERKLTAIVCADVVGYSKLVAADEEEALRRLMACRDLFDAIVSDGGGRIFNTAGDAVLAEFPSAVNAVRAAIDIQESLRTRNRAFPESRQMVFRIGISVGDVVVQDGDLLGDAVNIAARLQTLAAPGGICLSNNVREQVTNKMTAQFTDLGRQTLKNIPEDVHAFLLELGDAGDGTAQRRGGAKTAAAILGTVVLVAAALGLIYQFQRTTGDQRSTTETVTTKAAALQDAGNIKDTGQSPEKPAPTPRQNANRDAGDAAARQPRASNPAPKNESMKGRAFRSDEVPFICDDCRKQLQVSYVTEKGHRALAITVFGETGIATGMKTPQAAKEAALANCRQKAPHQCEIYAVDGHVVWDHPRPVLPARPWIPENAGKRLFLVDDSALLDDAARTEIRRVYMPAPGAKAIAIGTGATWSYHLRRSGDDEAMRMALETCAHSQNGEPCRIAVLNDYLITR